jgi:hypothetical protein
MRFHKEMIEEAGALPEIVGQGVRQIDRRLPLEVVDAGYTCLGLPAWLGCGVPDGVVIGFWPAGEGIEEVDLPREIGPLDQPAASVRLHLSRKTPTVHPDLRRPVTVEIYRLDL